MVGILQFFDFSQASSSRKLLAVGKHNNGFEPPRNSLEFSMEAYQSLQVVHEGVQHSHNCSNKDDTCKHQTHKKKLMDDKRLGRTKDRDNRPSVVARLMGMDALPSDANPTTHAKELKDERRPRMEPTDVSPNQQALFILKPMKHLNDGFFPEEDFDQQTRFLEMDKPQPRKHPQEELLQKFKKEFEAWQASRMWERSTSLDQLANDLPHKGCINSFPQENFYKEKMSRYVEQKRSSVNDKITEFQCQAPSVRPHRYQEQEDHFKYDSTVSKLGGDVPREDTFGDNRRNILFTPISSRVRNVSTSPGRIVILKPGYETNQNADVSFLSSPVMLDKQRNMKCFLEQVNERLIKEIQGKHRLETATRSCQAFVSERLANSKQIALNKDEQVREGVSRGNKITVLRSKPTKSYRNEAQPCGVSSPDLEFHNQNTKKSLSERMKNVLRDEADIRFPVISRGKTNTSTQHFSKKGSKKSSYSEVKKVLNESKSFRHDPRQEFYDERDSPRKLVRSYSAPVSGTEFGKLLLEDKDALTAVHIHRKHEADNSITEARKMKKDSFSIKSRVSSLRQNLLLKGKFFGKRTQLMDESAEDELPLFMNATETSPSVIMNLGFAQDNSTEVPPSPASVCSSSHDEICRPYYPSPVSPLEAQFHEDHPSLPLYEELNSRLLDSNLSEELHYNRSEESSSSRELKPAETELPVVESSAKTYIRDILITSGLFERNHFDQALWEWDTPRKPVSMLVFEEVEETYRNNGKPQGTTFHLSNAHTGVSPRILFDLLNESLQRVVQCSKLGSSPFKKCFPGARRLPHGNELLETLWQIIQLQINLPGEEMTCPIEAMVAQEVKTPWSGMLHEDIGTVCLDIESLIVEDLIDEFVCSNLPF